MKRLFGEINMTWLKVILFAVITGVYTGLIMLVPFLDETSFQDIGISYEFWVIFAVIVVVNCKKNVEAMLKCFVFFLISQPLVYGVEIVAGHLSFEKALGYYKFWFILTILTLPGGFIAYYAKKQNLLGAIVLGLGNTIQCLMGLVYIIFTMRDFPHHLLSAIVSFVSIAVMSICIQEDNKRRLISGIVVPVVACIIVILVAKAMGRVLI